MDESNELIFVSIASYRDIQLVPTVQDLLLKAQAPSLLRFGICWQHDPQDPDDVPLPFLEDAQFRVLDVDWRQSRGACWARAEVMKLWQGEQYFLQLDSHCRFAQDWDTRLIRMMAQIKMETGSSKPILSTYAFPFDPISPYVFGQEHLAGEAQLMGIGAFSTDGIPLLKPLPIPQVAAHTAPLPARFLAAGFLFTLGSLVEQVPYDPELYFFGEEITMTLRAFTAGFDLFHPVEQIVWHDYVRSYAVRHWDNHAETGEGASPGPSPSFEELDRISRKKILQILGGARSAEPDPFGLGSVRSLADYEAYAGLSFALRKIQDYTRLAQTPPNPALPPDWPARIYTWLVRLVLEPDTMPAAAFEKDGFWVIALQDEQHREIYRHDWPPAQLETITDPAVRNLIVCEVESGIIPVFWTLWPYSKKYGWLQKVSGTLSEDDFNIVTD